MPNVSFDLFLKRHLCGGMVKKLGQYTIVSEFDSYWMPLILLALFQTKLSLVLEIMINLSGSKKYFSFTKCAYYKTEHKT